MSFVKRKISVKFELGEGSFGESGSNAVEVTDRRISATIVKAGGNAKSSASLVIYGMTLSVMNKLSTLGLAVTLDRRNTITITAGDNDKGMGTVFVGTIRDAFTDFSAMPQVGFHVMAYAGLFEAVKPANASSYKGSTDVATIFSSLAQTMGMNFENNGVSVMLSNPYFHGSARDQAAQVAKAAGVEWIIDNGKLAIWKAGSARGGSIPLISETTGMIKLPSFTQNGIRVETLFNSSIDYGAKVKVECRLTPANGEWITYNLLHNLDAQVPRGRWFTQLQAARPGLVIVS